MKRRESSLISLFQDPLLTLVALVLINMVWIILPSVNPDGPKLGNPPSTPNEARRLVAVIESLEHQLERLSEREKQLPPGSVDNNLPRNRQEELRLRIDAVNAEIDRLTREKKILEGRKAGTGDGTTEAARQARLDELRRQIEAKREELRQLEAELAKATEQSARQLSEAEKERADLERNVRQAKERVSILTKQRDDKQDGQANPGEFKVTPVSFTKKDINWVEVVSDRVHVVWFNEINTDAYTNKDFGLVRILTRKPDAKGDDAATLEKKDCLLRKALATLDPKADNVLFLVHSDSIGLFRKARRVAEDLGFDTGWYPCETDFLNFGQGGDTPGTTSPPSGSR